jgi:hypothetical protein
MEDVMIKICITIFVVNGLLLISCNNNSNSITFPFALMRQAQAVLFYEPGVPNSLNVSVALEAIRGELDHRQNWYSKVEWNPGDGAGWIDITEDYRNNMEQAQTLTYAIGYKHTYAAPGTYQVQARVTYWDGEVVYSMTSDFIVPDPRL